MNVTPLYRNSTPTFAGMKSNKSVGVDFGAVMKAKKETEAAKNPPPRNMKDFHMKVNLNYGLAGGGNGIGYTYTARYAENSTEDDPIVTVDWTDPDGNEYKEHIRVNNVDPRNATFVEMTALGAHLGVDSHTIIPGHTATLSANRPYDQKVNFIAEFEQSIDMAQRLGSIVGVRDNSIKMGMYLDFVEKAQAAKAN